MDKHDRAIIGLFMIAVLVAIIAFWAIDYDQDAKFNDIDTRLQAIERYVQHVRAINELQEEVNVKLPLALRWLELQERMKGE